MSGWWCFPWGKGLACAAGVCLSVCLSGNKDPTRITPRWNPHPVLLQLLRLTNIALSWILFSSPFPLSVWLLSPFFYYFFFFSASALYYIKFNSLLPHHEIFLFLCKKKGREREKKNFPTSPKAAPSFLLSKELGLFFSRGRRGGWKLNIKQCRQLRVYFGKLIVRLFWLLWVSAWLNCAICSPKLHISRKCKSILKHHPQV